MDFWGTLSHLGAILGPSKYNFLSTSTTVFDHLTERILKKQEMSGEILKKQEFLLLQEELHPCKLNIPALEDLNLLLLHHQKNLIQTLLFLYYHYQLLTFDLKVQDINKCMDNKFK